MPPQQGVWLNDQNGILPSMNQPCQEEEEHAIRISARWPFHLPFEDDELLSQESVFHHQLGLASAKVGQSLERQGGSERFRPTSKAGGERMQAVLQEAQERGQNTSHKNLLHPHECIV